MQIIAIDQTPGHSQMAWQQDTCTVNEIILNLLDCSFDGGKPLAFTCSRWAYLGARSTPDNQNWSSRPCNVCSFEMVIFSSPSWVHVLSLTFIVLAVFKEFLSPDLLGVAKKPKKKTLEMVKIGL